MKQIIKNIKIISFVFIFVLTGVFINNTQVINAQELSAEDNNDTGIIEFYDQDGNVMATYIPYSETNPAPDIMPRYSSNLNWTIGNGSYSGSSRFEMNTNTKINLSIAISPSASSNIGLYDNNKHEYGYPASSGSSTGWYGTIVPSRSGNYSIAIRNNTSKQVTYNGTFSVN